MKAYKVKNYKGNLVESLSRFQKKYPGMKICEAVEVNASEAANTEEQFSIDWDTSNKDATEYFNSETEAKKYWNSVVKKYGIKFWMNFTGSAGGNPEVTFKGPKKNLEKFIFEYLAHGDKKEYAEAVDDINEFNDTDFSKQYNESANDKKELQIKVKESIGKEESMRNLNIWIGGYLYNSEDDFRDGDAEELANEFLADYDCDLPMDEIVSEIEWAQKHAEVDKDE